MRRDARHMSRPVPSPSMKGIMGLLGTLNFSPSTVILVPSVGTSTPLKLAIDCQPPLNSSSIRLGEQPHCTPAQGLYESSSYSAASDPGAAMNFDFLLQSIRITRGVQN